MKVLKRWLARAIGILTILFILAGVGSFIFRPNEPPNLKKAPWAIQTYSQDDMRIPSRIYYLEGYELIDGYAMSTGNYWSYDGEVYRKHNNEQRFDMRYIDIVRRKQ